jgi:hypothetical protein
MVLSCRQFYMFVLPLVKAVEEGVFSWFHTGAACCKGCKQENLTRIVFANSFYIPLDCLSVETVPPLHYLLYSTLGICQAVVISIQHRMYSVPMYGVWST